MKYLILLAVSCTSCAYGIDLSYREEKIIGYRFHVRYVEDTSQPTDDINYTLAVLVSEMADRGINSSKLMSKFYEYGERYPIYVVNKEIKHRDCPYGRCKGVFFPSFPYWRDGSIAFIENKCVGLTPLAHELIHLTDFLILDRVDSMHKNAEFFEVGCLWRHKRGTAEMRECINHSVERTINKRLCDRLCGGCTEAQLDWQFETPP